MTSSLRLSLATCTALFAAAFAAAAEPAIIAKARAYIGTESALESLKSVHYTGTLVTADPKDPAKQARAAMEIIFQRPDRHRIMATTDKVIEVTALDGYDGWQRVQDAADASKWQQTLLGTEQIKKLRAIAWENLSFYRGLERRGGQIEDQGTKVIDGVTTQRIAFIHAPHIIFYRHFDVATGRLVFTETQSGETIRETGEMVVNGLRFPKTIVTTSKNPAGVVQTATINFEKIQVNETFPDSHFAVPAIPRP
jgi:outer membrane lipoprotein-sorting protein